MNSFVDSRKISSYSLALSEKLINEIYSERTFLSGKDIKNLSQVEQINLLVFKNLFEKWQDEAAKLRSPYFDYDKQEVREALSTFLNVLSNHISISREFFKPLLTKAIEDTLYLIYSPVEYFILEITGKQKDFFSSFTASKKFLRTNTDIVVEVERLVNESGNDWEKLLVEVEKISIDPANATEVTNQLNSLLQLELGKEEFLEPEIEETPSPEIETAKENSAPELPEHKIVVQESETQEEVENTNEKENLSINERYARKEVTLNDLLRSSEPDHPHALPKIQDLRSAISLNEKFIFIKELFGNDPSAYALALAEVEGQNDLDSALSHLTSNYSGKFNWDQENPYLKDFINLVERRFN